MYKVFANELPIIIASQLEKNNNYTCFQYKDFNVKRLRIDIENNTFTGLVLLSDTPKKALKDFLGYFPVVSAAGGLVTNPESHILFIYRNNVWDLPKGKIEHGETIAAAALREVEEECGIDRLNIVKPLPTTWHFFYRNGLKIKQTYWFYMETTTQKKPLPQLEEGITKAEFVSKEEIHKVWANTYENIKLVLGDFT